MSDRMEWIIIGAGIAGLGTARALAVSGLGRGTVLEREPMCGMHASGRNAGILRLVEADPVVRVLAWRSREWLKHRTTGRDPLLRTTGGLTLAAGEEGEKLAQLAADIRHEGIPVTLFARAEATRRFRQLRDFRFDVALWCPLEGVVDVHALLTTMRQEARECGVEVRTRASVTELLVEGRRVTGVRVADREIRAGTVFDASGAWAGRLQGACTDPLGLRPMRRHLFVAARPRVWSLNAPFVWMLGDQFYLRREGAGFLLSPCDETPSPPTMPETDPAAREMLADKIARMAPALADLALRREWACLRTFAADRRPVIGADARLPGLHHVSGLGGFGVSAGPAIGELAASLIRGRCTAAIDATLVAPGRNGVGADVMPRQDHAPRDPDAA
jgi:D-arginine dehydrogenase